MKNNLDNIFVSGIDHFDLNDNSETSWKKLRRRMYLKKIQHHRFPIIIGAAVLLTVLLFVFFPANRSESNPQDYQLEFMNPLSISHLTSNATYSGKTNPDIAVPVLSSISPAEKNKTNSIKNINHPNIETVSQVESEEEYPKIIHSKAIEKLNFRYIDQEFHQRKQIYKQLKNNTLRGGTEKPINHKPARYLGGSLGGIWPINYVDERNQTLTFSAGLTFRIDKGSYFINTSLDYSLHKSTNASRYFYDTLVGQLVSPGFEIVPTVNNEGDTVFKKVYDDKLVDVYDTVLSDKAINLLVNSTVISLPLSIGRRIIGHDKVSVSVMGGLTFNLISNAYKSVPRFDASHEEVIKFENNITSSLNFGVSLHAGLDVKLRLMPKTYAFFEPVYHHLLVHSKNCTYPHSSIGLKLGVLVNF